MAKFTFKNISGVSLLLLVVLFTMQSVLAQTIDYERSRHQAILSIIKSDIKKYYYDTNFRGIDLDTRFKTAEERIKKANSIGEMNGIIAQVLVDFNDSHLKFFPPGKANKIEFGWEIQMIGDKCFVIWVKSDSDAALKGLKPGDEIYSIEGFEPTRENMWKMNYFYRLLRPRPAIKVEVIKPDGTRAELELKTKITEGKRLKNLGNSVDYAEYFREITDEYLKSTTQRYYEGFENILIWKMPEFALTPNAVDEMIGKVKKRQSLILDLRGNGGGRVDMLSRLLGHMFAEDVIIGERKERKKTEMEIAKGTGKDAFQGKIIVLIDSESASASEVFARVIQLEKRGTILGDVSEGKVMTSRFYNHEVGMDIVAFFSVNVTIADLIMKDGKSLEHIGVTPDERILPTAQDLANRRDPVLARALKIVGIEQTPEQAGALFHEEKIK
jgi:C-terminal processing protease CtpA/Prc